MKRGFTVLSKSWYAEACLKDVDYVDEVMFGLYDDDRIGGTSGEMAIKWHKLNGENIPRFESFDDSWAVLATFTDVIIAMGKYDDKNITPDQFAELLISLGFEDMTQAERGS